MKEYKKPTIEITEFESENIMRLSSYGGLDENFILDEYCITSIDY